MLFADIRGFTRLSESLGTEATSELMTEFHHLVTRIVFDHRGTLEKCIGGLASVRLGIGVHYGEGVLGSIGDAQRLDYVRRR